ncbi:concanavalin A-like lectin/glucanase superfamily protein [Actinocrispum wychmicini]|uniref:Concanavalin A-like lectin/glucanase superfamily protein n=1 Tax=Actinocrispum wychmicini TaxID=1213861 RepID=A0A4R2JDX3_9PSEU|nr:concanavalin A-like lectin/glucanase superfamily protein [Actinocrispum wychmicini]
MSAWVRLAGRAGSGVAISQDGGFALGYSSDVDKWAFTVRGSSGQVDVAVADAPAQHEVWTHLAGVYDSAGTGSLRLYVNGRQAGGTAHLTTSAAALPLSIGGGPAFWRGAVDDVQVFDRALGDREPQDLAQAPALLDASWSFDEGSGTATADSSGNGHSGRLTGGVSWQPGRRGAGSLTLDGATGSVRVDQPMIHTEDNFTVAAWVRLDDKTGGARVAVSQGDRSTGTFTLGYHPDIEIAELFNE